MIPLAELNRVAAEARIDVATVERDYAISWLLYGVFKQEALTNTFVFKGGTALRKCYFSDYRFSQDLDFTLTRSITKAELNKELKLSCQEAYNNCGVDYQVLSVEKTRDEQDEEAFKAKVTFIGPRKQRGNPTRIEFHLTLYENVILNPAKLSLLHNYSDSCQSEISVYQLEELIAEKLRTILQRAFPRDFYDAWNVLKFHKKKIDTNKMKEVFLKKCEYKKVNPVNWDEYLQSKEVMGKSKHFKNSLNRQIKNVPKFEDVISDLKVILTGIF